MIQSYDKKKELERKQRIFRNSNVKSTDFKLLYLEMKWKDKQDGQLHL